MLQESLLRRSLQKVEMSVEVLHRSRCGLHVMMEAGGCQWYTAGCCDTQHHSGGGSGSDGGSGVS